LIVSKKCITATLPNNFDYPTYTVKKYWLKRELFKLSKERKINLGFEWENCADKLWMI